MAVRQRYADIVTDASQATFRMLHESNQNILAFARVDAGQARVAVVST